ncbi:protein FAM3C [Chanos chanos]|uniref:Protein FAM3C n=1 Tax=Chanos chanos TaxID=29144 RepID=A0A6J2VMS7_CHACN|nr:protein FAM3C-like [Chanos chanos]
MLAAIAAAVYIVRKYCFPTSLFWSELKKDCSTLPVTIFVNITICDKFICLFKPIRRPCPNQNCPLDHFPFHIRSGAATAIGPKICFNGQVVMGGTKSNMGRGLNIVVIEGETGKVLKYDYFNMYSGNPKELLNFLKTIVPGNIVLIASFDDPATKLTDEIRDIFEGFGSSMIKSLKFRDSWVFAGAPGLEEKSPFEKRIPNDSKTNVYGQWPELVEMDGCFPRKI